MQRNLSNLPSTIAMRPVDDQAGIGTVRGLAWGRRVPCLPVWLGVPVLSLLLFALWGTSRVHAQSNTTATDPRTPTAEATEERLKLLAENTTLDEAVRASIREELESAQKDLARVKEFEQASEQYNVQKKTAVANLEQLRKTADQSPPPIDPASVRPPNGSPLSDLEADANRHEDLLRTNRQRLSELDAEPKRRATRLKEIPGELAKIGEEISKAEAILSSPPETSEVVMLDEARRWAVQAKLARLLAQSKALQAEADVYQATGEQLRLERDLVAAEVARSEVLAKRWQEIVLTQRQREAERQAMAARKAAFQASPALKQLAEDASVLAEKRTYFAEEIAKAAQRLSDSQVVLDRLRQDFQRARERLKAVGLSDAMGQILRRDRNAIPDNREFRRLIRERKEILEDAHFLEYDYLDRRSELSPLEERVEKIAKSLAEPASRELRDEIRNLLESKRDYLDQLISDSNKYTKTLLDLNVVEGQIIAEGKRYASFIDERVLWIRSTHLLHGRDASRAMDALAWLASPVNWYVVVREVWNAGPLRFWSIVVCVVGWLLLISFQKSARRLLGSLGEQAQRKTCTSFLPTLRAVWVTAIISSVWPVFLLVAAWFLYDSRSTGQFGRSLSAGFFWATWIWFPLEYLRQICRPKGLAAAHLEWPAATLGLIRRNLRWINLICLLPLVVMLALETQSLKPYWSSSLGRMAFLGLLAIAFWFLCVLLRSKQGVIAQFLAFHPDWFSYRTHPIWVTGLLAAPLVLAGLAVVGYYDTAKTLVARCYATACVALLLALAQSVVARWILLRRRKLAMEQARQRRAAEQIEDRAGEVATGLAVTDFADNVDLGSVSQQMLRLTGMLSWIGGVLAACLIWSDVVPALTLLNNYPLWPGATSLTIADALLAGVIIAVTWVAVRNVVGVLELTLWHYMPLDRGARYAVATLSRYAVLTTGVIATAQALGVEWSSVQWLVAAMSIGLGFGLQEIFANFVSGIVLLFERPIRVGDVVTLGDTTGVVTRIRIRATTITDFDRKEFVVPNKDFITGRLLNWTLTDPTNRIVLRVGVAYGSDTELARNILLRIVSEHPSVLKEPEPTVTLENFGESALEFVVRCFLPDLDNRLNAIHDLHANIDQAFREAGIVIPFPQRELHVLYGSMPPPSGLAAARGEKPAPGFEDAPRPRKFQAGAGTN